MSKGERILVGYISLCRKKIMSDAALDVSKRQAREGGKGMWKHERKHTRGNTRERERERDGIQQITKTPSCNKKQKTLSARSTCLFHIAAAAVAVDNSVTQSSSRPLHRQSSGDIGRLQDPLQRIIFNLFSPRRRPTPIVSSSVILSFSPPVTRVRPQVPPMMILMSTRDGSIDNGIRAPLHRLCRTFHSSCTPQRSICRSLCGIGTSMRTFGGGSRGICGLPSGHDCDDCCC